MSRDDRVRMRHMLDAAREACGFATGKRRVDLNQDRQLVLSLVKCVEIIGEAASRVSVSTQSRCPEIPWPDIVGMRNRLIHVYFDIDLDRVWDTVVDDLPSLIVDLEKIVSSTEEG